MIDDSEDGNPKNPRGWTSLMIIRNITMVIGFCPNLFGFRMVISLISYLFKPFGDDIFSVR